VQFLEGAGELLSQLAEIALDSAGAADQHMVGPGKAPGGQKLSGERAQAALHAVANDRAADLLGDGETDAHRLIRVLPLADEQDETGRRHATAAVRGKKVGALLDRG
jgi:hypothetical protein